MNGAEYSAWVRVREAGSFFNLVCTVEKEGKTPCIVLRTSDRLLLIQVVGFNITCIVIFQRDWIAIVE